MGRTNKERLNGVGNSRRRIHILRMFLFAGLFIGLGLSDIGRGLKCIAEVLKERKDEKDIRRNWQSPDT